MKSFYIKIPATDTKCCGKRAGCALLRCPGLGQRSGGRSLAKLLLALQHRWGFKEDFVFQFTISSVSTAGILITVLYLAVFKTMVVNVLVLVVAILR